MHAKIVIDRQREREREGGRGRQRAGRLAAGATCSWQEGREGVGAR